MIRVDLHLHTKFSGDAQISPKQIVNELHAHPFIKTVAITDHDTLEGYFQVRKLAAAFTDLVIIPGVEVSTEKGDIILLGAEEKPAYKSPLDSVINFALERAALIIIPHPYRVHGIGDAAEKMRADAVEVMNPWATPRENKMAEELAKTRHLPRVAGSDAHLLSQMWAAYTEVEAESSVDGVLRAIRSGHVKPVASTKI